MATIEETIWVRDAEQLNATVGTLVGQGGVVVTQQPDSVLVEVKKKLNVVLLVVLLLLFCVPGIAYLIWHTGANANQAVTVRIGQPSNIGGYQPPAAGEPSTASLAAAPLVSEPTPPPYPIPGYVPPASSPGIAPAAALGDGLDDPFAVPYVPGLPYPETVPYPESAPPAPPTQALPPPPPSPF